VQSALAFLWVAAQKLPEIVFLEQPFSWVQPVVSAFQIVFLGFLTIYTFRSNSRQKIVERQAAWYHKLVVDPMIDKVSEFFDQSEKILCAAAKLADDYRAGRQVGLGPDATKNITAFKELLYDLSRDIQYRISPFGFQHEERVSQLIDDFEDKVTLWFDQQARASSHEPRADLRKLLKNAQVGIFKELIDIEFDTWGLSGAWARLTSRRPWKRMH
jgi:hypothetical protein